MKHRSYRFGAYRSEVEIEWALTFKLLNIEFEYEPKAFHLPHINYLPDFYLPYVNKGCWVECKSQKGNEAEMLKAKELSEATKQLVVIVHGYPSTGRIYDCWYCGEHAYCFFDSRTNKFEQSSVAKFPKSFREQEKIFGPRNSATDRIVAKVKDLFMESQGGNDIAARELLEVIRIPYQQGWHDWTADYV